MIQNCSNSDTALERQRGLTLFEVVLALAASSALLIAGAVAMRERIEDVRANTASEHLRIVTEAAESYVGDHYESLTADQRIEIATLKAAGYLPASFQNGPYGHQYEILVNVQDVDGNGIRDAIDALVVAGGATREVEPKRLPGIAAMAGAKSGMIVGEEVQGAFGGWQATLTDFPASAIPDLQLASLLHFDDLSIESDYLFRKAVAGRPELNRMETSLDMDGNDIDDIAALTGRSGMLQINDNATVENALSVGGDLDAGSMLARGNVTANGNITSDGTISGTTITSTGSISASGRITGAQGLRPNLRVTPGASCSVPGLIGRDSRGKTYNCADGRWEVVGEFSVGQSIENAPSTAYCSGANLTLNMVGLAVWSGKVATVYEGSRSSSCRGGSRWTRYRMMYNGAWSSCQAVETGDSCDHDGGGNGRD
jgi:competence protein ComGC